MKRLTIVPPDRASDRQREAFGEPGETGVAGAAIRMDERRKQPRIERRLAQRRRAIARRVMPDRRFSSVTVREALFVESRSGMERRVTSARRRLSERRAGVRKIDLTNLDLSELDH